MSGLGAAGAVLTGGRSRRMGRDKVAARVGGAPLAARAVGALVDAGADPVACIGGDAATLAAAGLTVLPDGHPDEGPLGGLLTALELLEPSVDVVVVLAGDLARPDPRAVVALVDHLRDHPAAAAAIPVVDGRPQWLHGAWRRRAAGPVLRTAFDGGIRAVHVAAAALAVAELVVDAATREEPAGHTPDLDPRRFADVDTPDELARLLRPGADDELA